GTGDDRRDRRARRPGGGVGRQPPRPAPGRRRRIGRPGLRRALLHGGPGRARRTCPPRLLGRGPHRPRPSRRAGTAGRRGGGGLARDRARGVAGMTAGWWRGAAAAIAVRPRLWPVAAGPLVRLAAPGWWRRWPPV